LLCSLTIICLLAVLVVVGFKSLFGAEFDSQVSDLADTLIRARAHAMANNTYTFVGIAETNDSVQPTAVQVAGNGRLGVTIVASNDGTAGYTVTAPAALSSSNLTVVSPLRHFENLHLLSSSGISGLPNASSGATYNIQNTNSLTTFQWPLTGTTEYSFGSTPGTVIQFSPQGEAQIMPTGTTNDSILQWIEIDLEPTHGTRVPSTATNTAAILISGSTGAVMVYRR
jgi:Tfp pilus assembly protein FimT